MTDPYATLRALLRDLDALRDHGCSDGNCKMRRKIGGMHTNGESMLSIARFLRVSRPTISRLLNGRTWR